MSSPTQIKIKFNVSPNINMHRRQSWGVEGSRVEGTCILSWGRGDSQEGRGRVVKYYHYSLFSTGSMFESGLF